LQRIPERLEKCGKRALDDREALVAEAGAYCNALAADGTAAAQHGSAGLGLHARPKSVRLHTVAAVGLKCALGHRNALLFPLKNLRFDSISEYIARRVRNPARSFRARLSGTHTRFRYNTFLIRASNQITRLNVRHNTL
jgi:hypothetical protein